MTHWIYVASPARACIADTRALVLRHRFIRHAAAAVGDVAPGDGVLLAFREDDRRLAALGVFLVEDAKRRANAPWDEISAKNGCYAEGVWDNVWDDFVGAREGVNGTGYKANKARRVLSVTEVDVLDDVWRGSANRHRAPAGAHFELRDDERRSEVMTRLAPGAFAGEMGARIAASLARTGVS